MTFPVFPLYYPLESRKSRIHGMGAWAQKKIPARRKIGSLGGVVVSRREAARLSRSGNCIALVELWNGQSLDATRNSNALRYVNHSCRPNTYMRVIGAHVEFYALRDIPAGEELTCDYGLTHHDGKLPCACGADNCRGFI